MTITELKAELARVEKEKFYLSCKDRWTWKDYETNDKFFETIQTLKKQIAALS